MPAGLDGNPDPIVTPARQEVLAEVADRLLRRRRPGRPLLAGIDGTPGGVELVDHVLGWVARIDRYASGMRYYLDSVDPMSTADVVIDNNDLARPFIVDG